ncbi:DUF4173 domain-containing protein [Streptomyces sp. RKND-216]|uniref:DUF4153 domain-containing protein n=1 Tax=Streptomyces sp. RKND-216 TaxID=2562581 RepID=UPI00109E1992|nr:DUF4173 domain-containing protein [Streptomyces sp. RKND-216]THA24149.1 DUF4173 domain-containing protein [Streptomyces sp. RKND-216]
MVEQPGEESAEGRGRRAEPDTVAERGVPQERAEERQGEGAGRAGGKAAAGPTVPDQPRHAAGPSADRPPGSGEPGPGPDLRKPPQQGEAAPGPRGGRGVPGGMAPHPQPPHYAYQPPRPAPPPAWVVASRPDDPPAPLRAATGWAAIGAGVAASLLLGEGLGVNLLLAALPAALAAHFAARTAGRRPRPWTLLWAAGCLALLGVPALRDAAWPSTLAVLAALAVGSFALQGGRSWAAALISPFWLPAAVPGGVAWAWKGTRERARNTRHRWGPVVRTGLIAVGLLVVFGALFAGADAAFADLLNSLVPDASVADGPLRSLILLLGIVTALAAARTAAAPRRWDRIDVKPGKGRGRVEWALPLIVLDVLFAVFNTVQLTVLFGGYDRVLRETGLTYAEYARQGFWQLLCATLLTLVVIALALRWAPRGRRRDATLVRAVLGTLCALTLVVVLSALRRMDLYVDAYGLTRLRLSVAGVELWLGLVIVMIMIAGGLGVLGRRGATWVPRAVTASAALGVLVFGLISPDRLVAEQNLARHERTGKIDLLYLRNLSADAVPTLDRLPEPLRSCALSEIARGIEADEGEPWYATSLGEARAREVLAKRPVAENRDACASAGVYDDGYRSY